MNKPKLYTGTAGWSYEDWIGKFYPFSHSKEFSWLKYYARYFNTVEVNSSYYSYLSPKMVASWIRQVEEAEDFQFTVKLHMDFTHRRNYNDGKIKAVKENLNMLKDAGMLGGLLMQFPYSFACNDASIDYLRGLIELFEEYDKFVEVRHRSWLNKRAKTITICSIDQPAIGEAITFQPVVGRGAVYARFHGRNKKAWLESLSNFGKKQTYEERSARYDYLYSPGELVEIADAIKETYNEARKVFVIMNNHPQGKAVANAFELLHYLKSGAKIKMPGTILNAYPRLGKFALNE